MRRKLVRGVIGRLERSHAWLPSWGTSLLVHGIALLILALIYFGSSPDNKGSARFDGVLGPPTDSIVQGEGLTSLAPAEVAGDPWTKQTSVEFPSLGSGIALERVARSNQPALPAMATLGPTLTPPRVAPLTGMKLSDSLGVRYHVEDMTAPFGGRDPEMKAKLIRREGGTVESEKAVQAGLDWLARHQRPDGGWSLDCHDRCADPPCPQDGISVTSDTAATGLGLLPMLGAGHIHTKKSRYQDNVGRGLDWLVAQQSSEGELYLGGGFNYRFYSHAIATMALCEAYGLSKDPKLEVPAQRAINFIAKNQSNDGGWRYKPGQAGDTSVIGWQMFALRSGQLAGLVVPKRTIEGCRMYLDLAAADPKKTVYSYLPGDPLSPVMTAEGLLCRQYLGWSNEHPSLRQGAKFVWDDLKTNGQRNIYYWYYATQVLHNIGGKEWIAWNKHVRDGLVRMQFAGTGCDSGSWDPLRPEVDRWGRVSGRLFTTSLSILTLEVYYRWLPLYRSTEEESDPKSIKDVKDREQAKAQGKAESPPRRESTSAKARRGG
jgi:hypothetical protein